MLLAFFPFSCYVITLFVINTYTWQSSFRIQRRLSNVGERGKKFGNVFLAFSRTLGNRNGLFHKEKT